MSSLRMRIKAVVGLALLFTTELSMAAAVTDAKSMGVQVKDQVSGLGSTLLAIFALAGLYLTGKGAWEAYSLSKQRQPIGDAFKGILVGIALLSLTVLIAVLTGTLTGSSSSSSSALNTLGVN